MFYINDLPQDLHSTVRLFADDTVVYLTIKSEAGCLKLQSDLNKLEVWEERWKMEFHPEKCSVLTVSKKKTPVKWDFKLHGQTLKHETSTKYLGCTITNDLDWGEHITNITNKASRSLGFLNRNLHVKSRNIKEKAYLSLVRPQLEYATTVWDPYHQNQIDKVEKVQRRAARFVTNQYSQRQSVTDMLEELKWKSLQQRRKEARLIMFYKIVNDMVAIDKDQHLTKPLRRSRHTEEHAYTIQTTTKDFRKWSFFPNTTKDWNKLPPDIAQAESLESFKAQVTKMD